jgi:hypothetical protein
MPQLLPLRKWLSRGRKEGTENSKPDWKIVHDYQGLFRGMRKAFRPDRIEFCDTCLQ